jgi:hypothetical protein
MTASRSGSEPPFWAKTAHCRTDKDTDADTHPVCRLPREPSDVAHRTQTTLSCYLTVLLAALVVLPSLAFITTIFWLVWMCFVSGALIPLFNDPARAA